MAWFKVDDKLHDHRKTRKVLRGFKRKRRDVAPMGLWAVAGSWCADNLTDGFVPADELHRWDDDADTLAGRLVDAGLWVPAEQDGEEGYRFHNWSEPGMQPTREQVERRRDAARERMRKVRENRHPGSPDVRANSDANVEGTSHDVRLTPTRPDPTPSMVTSSHQVQSPPSGPVDDDLTKIAKATGGDRAHAAAVYADVLDRCATRPGNPLGYVLRAIGNEPDRYKPTHRPPRRGEECPTHAGQWADRCNGCAADRKAAG